MAPDVQDPMMTAPLPTPRFLRTAAAAGCAALLLLGCGGSGGSSSSTASAPAPAPFSGTVVLGSPTATSLKLNLHSATQRGSVLIEYGKASGGTPTRTASVPLLPDTPLVLSLDGLAADAAYTYRVAFQAEGTSTFLSGSEGRFHTARPAGSTFTFTVQADSHMDENSSPDIYARALGNVLADAPDFHVDLGDTFMCEKHSAPLTATVQRAPDAATVLARYRYERTNFGIASHAVPLFLTNGNHEGESGWLANGTADNIAVWATQARQRFYLNPVPDGFYSGDLVAEPFVGQRASWYAWTWGDALFIVLDPFWHTQRLGTDGWGLTLGARQYQWLQQTLAASTAPFKFVFIHNLVGGLVRDGNWRGGVEAAPYFEWGGRNLDGTDGFAANRPGWALPIHDLLVKHRVTAVFHGHDHLYAKQDLDGIVYQEVPQPSAVNATSGPTLATQYQYLSGTILSSSGHLRITVGPGAVTSDYVRTWLPASETTTRHNGQVDHTWTVTPPTPQPR